MFYIIEKKNPLALHAVCETLEEAQFWVDKKAPEYCLRGYFMDKTLTPNDFEIINKGKKWES